MSIQLQVLAVAPEANDWLGIKEETSYGLLWLLIVLIIVTCLYAMSLLKDARVNEIAGEQIALANQQIKGREGKLPRKIPAFLPHIPVTLRDSGRLSTDAERVLNIPILGVWVGDLDANGVIQLLDEKKELIRLGLEERLADARYDDLIRADGEQYLKKIILESIGESLGISGLEGEQRPAAQAEGQFGVVEISLPRSYSVH